MQHSSKRQWPLINPLNQTPKFEYFSVNLSLVIKIKIGHCVAAWPLGATFKLFLFSIYLNLKLNRMEVEGLKLDPKNNQFNNAVDLILNTNKNIYLTGKAGTGKTTFLKYIKQNIEKKTIILAPTGIASINAGGTTINSFFHSNMKIFLNYKNIIYAVVGECSDLYRSVTNDTARAARNRGAGRENDEGASFYR